MVTLPSNNLAYPVHISISQQFKGSGFYCNTPQATYLVTAKHVLFRNGLELFGKDGVLISTANDLVSKVTIAVDFETLQISGNLKKHVTADVAVVKLGTASDGVLTFAGGVTHQTLLPTGVGILGMASANTRTLDEVTIGNEVFLFGYVGSALGRDGQIDRSRPLLRKGIVAGKTEDRRIIVDCPVYFGNSGALVIELKEENFAQTNFGGIGVATEMIPFVEELWSKQFNTHTGIRYENSGYALVEPIDRIRELF